MTATFRQDGQLQCAAECELAHNAVTTIENSSASRVRSQPKAVEDHRVSRRGPFSVLRGREVLRGEGLRTQEREIMNT